MTNRIVIDPVTRIEGHLRIELEVENNKIKDAYSAGTIFRGLEIILQGRDPRDAWALIQRICGVCTHIHAVASIRSVEDALQVTIPKNAGLIRSIMTGAQFIHDHVVHFYHLHALDWVDVVSALKADPKATAALAQSISKWPRSSVGYFTDVQNKIKAFIESGQLGIFTNGYWGHPAYKLPPEANLLAVAHYLEALDWQKDIVRIHTIFGGKNPHPNHVVGGMASAINMDNDNTINMERLNLVKKEIDKAIQFVEQVYLPDVMAIGSFYKDWGYGGGLNNYLVFGPEPGKGAAGSMEEIMPGGVILGGDLSRIEAVDPRDPKQIQEFVDHSWFEYTGSEGGLHPWDGETKVKHTGPKPPFSQLDVEGKYSWLKAPRWKGLPMEVGCLSRVVIGYAHGVPAYKDEVDRALKTLGVGQQSLFSALGRTLSRALETKLIAHQVLKAYNLLIENIKAGDSKVFDDSKWDPATWPKTAKGVGIMEAPRGALAHYINIEEGKIKNYQCVVPTTWNASPRDGKSQIGAYEASLIGTPMADPLKPLEVLRIIHSFDPCLACAAHLIEADTSKIISMCEFY